MTVLLIEDSSSVQAKVEVKDESETIKTPVSEEDKEVVTQSVSTEGVSQVLDVMLPDLGENIESADVAAVLLNREI
jgi:hypothetical protein